MIKFPLGGKMKAFGVVFESSGKHYYATNLNTPPQINPEHQQVFQVEVETGESGEVGMKIINAIKKEARKRGIIFIVDIGATTV